MNGLGSLKLLQTNWLTDALAQLASSLALCGSNWLQKLAAARSGLPCLNSLTANQVLACLDSAALTSLSFRKPILQQ